MIEWQNDLNDYIIVLPKLPSYFVDEFIKPIIQI